MKKILTIQDISCVGQCSLTVAMPIISAMGVETCILPSAILSTHTYNFKNYTFRDLTEDLPDIKNHWKSENISFDGIYTGFLANEAQVAEILEFIRCFRKPNTLLLVDPVMGDHGKIYSTYTPALCAQMAHLVSLADVITPNLTEACILANMDYAELISHQQDADYLERIASLGYNLTELGPNTVVITGIHVTEEDGNYIYNAVVENGQVSFAKSRTYGGGYSGTGDIYASILCGYLLQGRSAVSAAQKAASFIEAALKETYEAGIDRNEGILFEPYLHMLLEEDV